MQAWVRPWSAGAHRRRRRSMPGERVEQAGLAAAGAAGERDHGVVAPRRSRSPVRSSTASAAARARAGRAGRSPAASATRGRPPSRRRPSPCAVPISPRLLQNARGSVSARRPAPQPEPVEHPADRSRSDSSSWSSRAARSSRAALTAGATASAPNSAPSTASASAAAAPGSRAASGRSTASSERAATAPSSPDAPGRPSSGSSPDQVGEDDARLADGARGPLREVGRQLAQLGVSATSAGAGAGRPCPCSGQGFQRGPGTGLHQGPRRRRARRARAGRAPPGRRTAPADALDEPLPRAAKLRKASPVGRTRCQRASTSPRSSAAAARARSGRAARRRPTSTAARSSAARRRPRVGRGGEPQRTRSCRLSRTPTRVRRITMSRARASRASRFSQPGSGATTSLRQEAVVVPGRLGDGEHRRRWTGRGRAAWRPGARGPRSSPPAAPGRARRPPPTPRSTAPRSLSHGHGVGVAGRRRDEDPQVRGGAAARPGRGWSRPGSRCRERRRSPGRASALVRRPAAARSTRGASTSIGCTARAPRLPG